MFSYEVMKREFCLSPSVCFYLKLDMKKQIKTLQHHTHTHRLTCKLNLLCWAFLPPRRFDIWGLSLHMVLFLKISSCMYNLFSSARMSSGLMSAKVTSPTSMSLLLPVSGPWAFMSCKQCAIWDQVVSLISLLHSFVRRDSWRKEFRDNLAECTTFYSCTRRGMCLNVHVIVYPLPWCILQLQHFKTAF